MGTTRRDGTHAIPRDARHSRLHSHGGAKSSRCLPASLRVLRLALLQRLSAFGAILFGKNRLGLEPKRFRPVGTILNGLVHLRSDIEHLHWEQLRFARCPSIQRARFMRRPFLEEFRQHRKVRAPEMIGNCESVGTAETTNNCQISKFQLDNNVDFWKC